MRSPHSPRSPHESRLTWSPGVDVLRAPARSRYRQSRRTPGRGGVGDSDVALALVALAHWWHWQCGTHMHVRRVGGSTGLAVALGVGVGRGRLCGAPRSSGMFVYSVGLVQCAPAKKFVHLRDQICAFYGHWASIRFQLWRSRGPAKGGRASRVSRAVHISICSSGSGGRTAARPSAAPPLSPALRLRLSSSSAC